MLGDHDPPAGDGFAGDGQAEGLPILARANPGDGAQSAYQERIERLVKQLERAARAGKVTAAEAGELHAMLGEAAELVDVPLPDLGPRPPKEHDLSPDDLQARQERMDGYLQRLEKAGADKVAGAMRSAFEDDPGGYPLNFAEELVEKHENRAGARREPYEPRVETPAELRAEVTSNYTRGGDRGDYIPESVLVPVLAARNALRADLARRGIQISSIVSPTDDGRENIDLNSRLSGSITRLAQNAYKVEREHKDADAGKIEVARERLNKLISQTEELTGADLARILEEAGSNAEAAASVDEPWKLTQEEWREQRQQAKPRLANQGLTRRSGSEAVARAERVQWLKYGVEKPIDSEIGGFGGRPPTTHRDVVEKALREGQPVPEEVLAPYPDLAGEELAAEASGFGARVIEIPLEDLHTDEKRFQPRGADFSEETARRVAENFDPNLFEPIRPWKDPEDGTWYVLAGHSRLEGMKRRGASAVASRPFEGNEEEAIRFALTENDKGDSLTNAERAVYLRRLRAQEYTKKEQKEEAKRLYGRDAATVVALSYLAPDGKALDVLRRFEGNAVGESNDAETMAVWVGKLRRYHPELTDRHEREVYDWLSENYKTEGRRLSSFLDFREYVEQVIQRRTQLGEGGQSTLDGSLNFADLPAKSRQQQAIDRQLEEARRQLTKDERALSRQRKEYAGQDLTEEEWRRVLGDYEEDVLFSQRRVVELEHEAGAGRRQLKRSEMSLFDGVRANLVRANPNPAVLWPAKKLAGRIGVLPSSLNEAARKGWKCHGYPVSEWAVRHEGSGRLKGYRVPAPAQSALRENPLPAPSEWSALETCAIVTENEAHGGDSSSGLEIRFPEDPGEDVLEVLREAGFFFYTPADAPDFWAAKATPQRRLVAAALDQTGTFGPAGTRESTRENPEGFSGFGPLVFLGYSYIVSTSAGVFEPSDTDAPDYLFTTPEGDALLVVPAAYVEVGEGLVDDAAAEAMYERWTGFEADGADYRIAFEEDALLPAGHAERILYTSDRLVRPGDQRGAWHGYDHTFDAGRRPATLFGPALLVGNLRITERGILN